MNPSQSLYQFLWSMIVSAENKNEHRKEYILAPRSNKKCFGTLAAFVVLLYMFNLLFQFTSWIDGVYFIPSKAAN